MFVRKDVSNFGRFTGVGGGGSLLRTPSEPGELTVDGPIDLVIDWSSDMVSKLPGSREASRKQ